MSIVNQTVRPNSRREITAQETLEVLRRHILMDGFQLVYDPQASHRCYLHDALTGRDYLDFYSFFASQPVGYGHPRMREPDFQARLLNAASSKVANPDMYTKFYGEFVRTMEEVVGVPELPNYFFIDGGTLAIENALKAAFDWKVRKNLEAGRGEIGSQVIHFRKAFHGRSGYTLSLTNTADPRKTMYFPKFDWPRIDTPHIDFSLPEPQRAQDVARREAQSIEQIHAAIAQRGHDIACIIIETIQGEGGDNHFRGEFLRALRDICDKNELMLIFDEVQCGVGLTGRTWACQHFDVLPDMLCFGKKMQICGMMASNRLNEVPGVFRTPSRINSTWGGNVADMVRSTQYMRIIQEEQLVSKAAAMGERLMDGLHRLAEKHTCISGVRGLGLMCALDLPDKEFRDQLRKLCFERLLLVLPCGERSIRFRPVLDVEPNDIDQGLRIMDEALLAMACGAACTCKLQESKGEL